jgi:hypothetical protein
MAYNKDSMFDPVGVAALDPKVASYKKFIKDNLGQPDLLQFLQSDQGKKLDPNLAGAMIVLDQLEKARDNSPKGPAPTTSVVQDVGMAALQKAQQARMAMAPQQGIAQLPNPAMANAQFQGGIAAPTRQMAGGGIVAFAEGTGNPGNSFVLAPSEVYTDTSLDEYVRRRFGAGLDQLDPNQKQDVFRAYEQDYMQARDRAKAREAADPRTRRGYVPPVAAAPAMAATSPAIASTAMPPAAAPPPGPVATSVAAAGAGPAIGVEQGPGRAQTPPPGKIGGPPAERPPVRPPAEPNIFGGPAITAARKQIQDLRGEAESLKPTKEFDAYLADVQARNEKQGIGAAAAQYKDYLSKHEAEIKDNFKNDRWMAVAEAGFAMANAAAQNPQAGFLGALSVGGMAGAKQYTASLKDYRKSLDQMQDAKFALAQSMEAQKREDSREARTELEKDRARYDHAWDRYVTAATSLSSTLVSAETSEKIAKANRAARVEYNVDTAAYNHLVAGGMDPLEALKKVRAASPQVQAADIRAGAALTKEQYQQKYGDANRSAMLRRSLEAKASQGDAAAKAKLMQMMIDGGENLNPLGIQIIPDQQ